MRLATARALSRFQYSKTVAAGVATGSLAAGENCDFNRQRRWNGRQRRQRRENGAAFRNNDAPFDGFFRTFFDRGRRRRGGQVAPMLQKTADTVRVGFIARRNVFSRSGRRGIGGRLRFAASACFVIQRKKLAINTSTMKTKVSIGIAASFIITR